MEYQDIQSIGDVLRRTIEETNMQTRLDELRAADLWPRIVGEYIASNSMKPFVRSGVMTVRIVDASLRNELAMSRSALIREFNRLIGREVIHQIRFIG